MHPKGFTKYELPFHLPRHEHDTRDQVKWTRVPDLVEKRKVFIKGGWAYVPGSAQLSIVLQEFETNLDKALTVGVIRDH